MKDFALMIFIVLVYVSCSSSSKVTSRIKTYLFQMTTVSSDFENEQKIEIQLPKGKKTKIYPHNGKVYIEYQISYPDKSIFYVTNDIWNGSRLNVKNLVQIGINGHTKERLLDTISYSGGETNFWKEQFIGDIVVGYNNASNSRKSEFEKAIKSIKKLD